MAMASAKAIARIMAVCTRGAASGLRPIDDTEVDPIQPIAMAGAIVPMIMEPIAAQSFTDSIAIPSIVVLIVITTFVFSVFVLSVCHCCFVFIVLVRRGGY